jgi:hypothetical protein
MQISKEQGQFSEEFVRYLKGLSNADLRARPHARHFYHEILIPKLKGGERIDVGALKELITNYQRGKKDAKFDLVTLHGFAYIDHTSRRDSKYRLSPQSDPAGFAAAQRADKLIRELWRIEKTRRKK